jgi:hypothetical protein
MMMPVTRIMDSSYRTVASPSESVQVQGTQAESRLPPGEARRVTDVTRTGVTLAAAAQRSDDPSLHTGTETVAWAAAC